MVIRFYPTAKSFPEFYFGRREGKLFIELEPETGAGLFHKRKKLKPSLVGAGLIWRYQITKPGVYGLRFGPDDRIVLRIYEKDSDVLDNLYVIEFEAKRIVRDNFVGNVRINGIKLSSLSQREEEPSVGPTLWERLDA